MNTKLSISESIKGQRVLFDGKVAGNIISLLLKQDLKDAGARAEYGASKKQRGFMFSLISKAEQAELDNVAGYIATVGLINNQAVKNYGAWLAENPQKPAEKAQKPAEPVINTPAPAPKSASAEYIKAIEALRTLAPYVKTPAQLKALMNSLDSVLNKVPAVKAISKTA